MDYMEYNTEYQKVILKEQLRRGVPIKEALIDTIKNTDKKDVLEMFIMSNDFEGQIARNDEMLALLEDDPEFEELFANDSKVIAELKKTAEDRLKTLQEQDRENGEREEKEQDGELKQKEDDEHDERTGRGYNKEQDSSTITNEQDNQYRIPYPNFFSRNQMPVYGSEEFYIQNIKFNVKSCINSMHTIKTNVDLCPSPMMLSYLSSCKDVFDNNIKLGVAIQQMPNCDAELMMLSDELIRQSQLVIDTVNKYVEQYRQKTEKEISEKENDEQKLEQTKDGLEQQELQDDKKTLEIQQEEQVNSTPRKSWELSPEQKAEIQTGAQQISQEYNENQTNPQPQIEENVVDNSDISR